VIGGTVRRLGVALGLALTLLGCHGGRSPGPATPPTSTAPAIQPSVVLGTPVELGCIGCGQVVTCRDQIAGQLHADAQVTTYIGGWTGIAIEVSPLDTGALPAPSGVDPLRFVGVSWPSEHVGSRLADGEIAVLDGSGRVVATTGVGYRFSGEWVLAGSIGGPIFPRSFIQGFSVCGDPGSVIPA